MLTFLKGDATRPAGGGRRVIAHVCNDAGRWGRGFVMAVSRRWPEPEREYRRWHRFGPPSFALGQIQLVAVERDLWVANLIAQEYGWANGPPIRYGQLEACLVRLADAARELGASVHMPRIGCGLAGGNWDRVGPMVGRVLAGIDVTVYDLA